MREAAVRAVGVGARARVAEDLDAARGGLEDERAEGVFRTLKYRPSYPRRPFADLAAAQQWVDRFVRWYNTEYLHSAIRFVAPDARHFGQDTAQLAKRRAVYAAAQAKHPERWSRHTATGTPFLSLHSTLSAEPLNLSRRTTPRKISGDNYPETHRFSSCSRPTVFMRWPVRPRRQL